MTSFISYFETRVDKVVTVVLSLGDLISLLPLQKYIIRYT